MTSYAFAVQVRNEEPNKGLRGIELPDKDTPITFDINLSSMYRKDGDTVQNDLGADFPVLLYHTEGNGETNARDQSLPASSRYDGIREDAGAVYKNGNVTIVQDGSVLHVTITGFDTDADKFPTCDVNGHEAFTGSDGKLLIGNISTWRFDLVQPTKWKKDGLEKDIQTSFGENSPNGTVQVRVEVSNLSMKSSAGTGAGQNKDFDDTISTDNTQTTNRQLYGGAGLYDQQIFFSQKNEINNGSDGTDNTKWNGSDTAMVGSEVYLTAYFNQEGAGANNFEARTLAYDQLIKFDNAALEPSEEAAQNSLTIQGGNHDWETVDVYYVGKNGGWNHNGARPWEAGYDEEMKAIKEDSSQLSYYTSLSELRAAGQDMECVGILLKWRGCSVSTDSDKMDVGNQFKLRVRNTENLFATDENGDLISSYMLTMSTNAWTIRDVRSAGVEITDDTNTNPYTKYAKFAMNRKNYNADGSVDYDGTVNQKYFVLDAYHPNSVRVYRDDNYDKDKYDAGGYIGKGTAGVKHGDTLYIVPYRTTIQQHVAQKEGSNDKQSFDLDQKQRYVDFVITSSIDFDTQPAITNPDWKTEATISVKIPRGLTYIEGSACLANSEEIYSDDNKGQGRGSVSGGAPIEPASVGTDADGNTILTFVLGDIPVKEGNLPSIYYSCQIGDLTDPSKDVSNNQSFASTVTIQTNEDKRPISGTNGNIASAGFNVVKTSEFNIQKFGNDGIELDGEGSFQLIVNNSTSAVQNNIYAIDLLPQDMHGTYKLTELKVRVAQLTGHTSDITFYYTNDANAIMKDGQKITSAEQLSKEDILNNWQRAEFDQSTGEITGTGLIGSWPQAVAYVDDKLPADHAAVIDLKYEGDLGRTGETLFNQFTTHSLTTSARSGVYSRMLSGTVWYDENKDGAIGDTAAETRLANVNVSLHKIDAEGNPTGDAVLTTTTDANGYYSFGLDKDPAKWPEGAKGDKNKNKERILRAGDYAIVFSGDALTPYFDVTAKMADGVSDELSSKAGARTGSDGFMQDAIIQRVHLESIAEMKTTRPADNQQNVKYQNAGFIKGGYELPSTGGRGENWFIRTGILLIVLSLLPFAGKQARIHGAIFRK